MNEELLSKMMEKVPHEFTVGQISAIIALLIEAKFDEDSLPPLDDKGEITRKVIADTVIEHLNKILAEAGINVDDVDEKEAANSPLIILP